MPAIVITTLSDPVAIVHIPISLTHVYTTKIYWTIDRSSEESSEFFNITSNHIEMAIFGSSDLITHEWSGISQDENDEIMISSNWRVFEISSGDQDEIGNYDSPHLRHVSAPLAKAGISILYQSSYFTDFLLVKESDFEKARNIFTNQGWQVDPSATPCPRRRSILSPLTPSQPSFSPTKPSTSSTASLAPEITVLPSPLACIGYSRSAENRFSEKVKKFLVWPERCTSSSSSTQTSSSKRARTSYYNDNEYDDGTESEISEMIELDIERSKPTIRPFISYTKNEDGSSLVTEIKVLKNLFSNDNDEEGYGKSSELIQSGNELFDNDSEVDYDDEDEGEDHYLSDGSANHNSDVENDDIENSERVGRREFNGQTFTPPPEYSLPPTPYDKHHFDIFEDDSKSDYSVGEVPIKWSGGRDIRVDGEGDGEGEGTGMGRKRCLQLDLRGVGDCSEDEGDQEGDGAYHLDKSGLVTRFSDLLTSTSKPIRMLYSSTFHTANILVEARDVKKAKRLLERKRRSVEWN